MDLHRLLLCFWKDLHCFIAFGWIYTDFFKNFWMDLHCYFRAFGWIYNVLELLDGFTLGVLAILDGFTLTAFSALGWIYTYFLKSFSMDLHCF